MEETREVIQDRMICGLATILPIDKFVCMKAYIEHLSDAEFNRFAEEMKGYAKENCSIKEYAFMETWYGIQIALLHPTVKNIFKGGRKERDGEAKFDKKPGTKRPVRYIKKRVINKDDIQRCLNGDGEAVNRHTLVWYVIGHWRKLANGTKQFIKPYWKGPLRELKMALDDREREIVTGGTANA